ncbi:hypothetical protein HZS_3576 [Henneguya salminicola]|nr:hypothetical protein HZS_3576 [Henneguya salminicola]
MHRKDWMNVREHVENTCETDVQDFKRALINSFMFFKSTTPLTVCFFLLSQGIQKDEKSTLYRDNENAKLIFKR